MNLTGTFFTKTVGWYHDDQTTPLIMLAPTAVALVSAIAICAAIIHMVRHPHPRSYDYFDPGDILHVVEAASGGGLEADFPPFGAAQEERLKHSRKVFVQLGPLGAGESSRLGLLQRR